MPGAGRRQDPARRSPPPARGHRRGTCARSARRCDSTAVEHRAPAPRRRRCRRARGPDGLAQVERRRGARRVHRGRRPARARRPGRARAGPPGGRGPAWGRVPDHPEHAVVEQLVDPVAHGRAGGLKATVTYPPTMAGLRCGAGPARRPGSGDERSRGAGGAGLDHVGVGHGDQGQRGPSTCRWASSPDEHTGGIGRGRRDGGLRLHGWGPLPGLADGPGGSSTCRCSPTCAVLCGRDATKAAAAAEKLGWAVRRDRLAGPARAATTCSSSMSARPAARTPRSRSRPWTPASTCSVRSRWRTPSTRHGRWSRRPSGRRPGSAQHGRLQLPPGTGGGAGAAAG